MTTSATKSARTVQGPDHLRSLVGTKLGASSWHEVTQPDIDTFARVTGDLFWIHTDPQRAAQTPWGRTIAHGLYTLSLGPRFMYEIGQWEGLGIMQNYGYDKVRFTAPVPVGSLVRASLTLDRVDAKADGSLLRLSEVFERAGSHRPVCIAEFLLRFINPGTEED